MAAMCWTTAVHRWTSNVACQSGPARKFSAKPALGLNVGTGAQRNSAVQRVRSVTDRGSNDRIDRELTFALTALAVAAPPG